MQLTIDNDLVLVEGFPVLSLPSIERETKYFSINPFVPDKKNRCPLDCTYCVCHMDEQWHHNPDKFSHKLDEEALIDRLVHKILSTPEGKKGFPISICDYSDPFIKVHRPHVLGVIDRLIAQGASNMVYITTKVHPGLTFLKRLKSRFTPSSKLKLTIFVSLPPLKPGYESVSIKQRVKLVKDLVRLSLPICWYLRPLVEEWFDEALCVDLCNELVSWVPNHIILSGVVMSKEIESSLLKAQLVVPNWKVSETGKKQLLSESFEARVREIIQSAAKLQNVELGPVMSHRLCGTNGNHAYGCLICGKNDRFCQLFQIHHYGESKYSDVNQNIKVTMVQ